MLSVTLGGVIAFLSALDSVALNLLAVLTASGIGVGQYWIHFFQGVVLLYFPQPVPVPFVATHCAHLLEQLSPVFAVDAAAG